MRNALIVIAIVTVAGACSRLDPVTGSAMHDFGALNGARVELTAEGGIGGVAETHVITHDGRGFVYVLRQICGAACNAPIDSVSGALTPAAADSVFNVVYEQNAFALRDDYGVTKGAADMFAWTLRVTMEGRTKTVHADDGTMPPQMRTIVAAVRGTVFAARR
ncbi:MAG TPA: protealysin inhibitor emfourin [Gemmatimonadaceae bacterium]